MRDRGGKGRERMGGKRVMGFEYNKGRMGY